MESRYGGTVTKMDTLEIGTHFYVCNGSWKGRIVEINGKKQIQIDGEDRYICASNYELEIEILKVK